MANIGQKFKNFGRKIVVKLKYHPNILPLLVMVIGFIVFSLGYSNVSVATIRINRANMGLYIFASYLLSILSMVCLMNAFPRREKVKIPFLVLAIVMVVAVIVFQVLYLLILNGVFAEVAAGSYKLNKDIVKPVISARNVILTYIIIEAVVLVLILLIPVIKKLLSKVNTRVQINENENISSIDISND